MTTSEKVAARFNLFAMANLRPQDSGVEGAIIWVSAGEFSGVDIQHGPRIKVVVGNKLTTEGLKDSVPVRIATPPEVLGALPGNIKKQVIQFVNKNREILLQHWRGEISSREVLDRIEKI